MTVLSHPRPPLIDRALRDARLWCAGHIIDDRPALAHAVRVAVAIGEHLPHPAPELIAAALLHDVPEFAPPEVNITALIRARYGHEVARIIDALQAEHHALDHPNPAVKVDDRSVLIASTADKIVALTSLLRRAYASGDVGEFFTRRQALIRLLPYFHAFQHAGAGLVPADMSHALHTVLRLLDKATAEARTSQVPA